MSNGAMFDYDFINRYNAFFSPSTIHCKNTFLVNFFSKYLLQQAISRYDFTLPDKAGWDKAYFEYTLFCVGFGAVVNTPKFGTIFQFCTLRGYDINYMPKFITVTNPALEETIEREIGKDCEVIKMQPLYGSIMDIIGFYADLMALTSEAAGINILNSKLAYIFTAGTRNVADSFKRLYDNVASGEPMVVADEKLIDRETGRMKIEYFAQDLKNNYIANDLFESLKNIENKFLTDMGFNNTNAEKRERLIVDEVNANNEAIQSKASLWLETMRESMDKVNRMFNLNLGVKFKNFASSAVSMPKRKEGADNGK